MHNMAGDFEFLQRNFAIAREQKNIPVFVTHVESVGQRGCSERDTTGSDVESVSRRFCEIVLMKDRRIATNGATVRLDCTSTLASGCMQEQIQSD